MVTGWKVNRTLVPLDGIIAIIAFGSAVCYPGLQKIFLKRRKHILFGARAVGQIPIPVNDVDILVITEDDLMREEILEPISVDVYDVGTCIEKGGIHLANRGMHQLLKGQ